MNVNKSVSVYTLGCRVNMYESCVIAEELQKHGFVINKQEPSDYYIINTCAVTAESERKSRQLVRRFANKGKVLVIGCASQLNPCYFDIDNVIYIGGNREKLSVVNILCGYIEKDKISVSEMSGATYEEMSLCGNGNLFSECRAFIKIQDGCNGKCTYCIIPKCRGPVRSRSIEAIIDETKRLVNNGYNEIILTGIEVSAYNKAPLAELISEVAKVSGVKRLRLGSLSPNVINEAFLEKISRHKNFMPHIHLSLQSCCDSVLKRMMRPYRKKDIYDKVELIRKYIPNCMISADIIVGFPGETDADYKETVDAVRELKIFHLHSFPYSEREGTKAAEMNESVPKNIRSERNTFLISSLSDVKNKIFDEMIGKNLSVLVEKVVGEYAYGHSEEFLETKFTSVNVKIGDIYNVEIISHDGNILTGTVIK